MIPEKDDLHRIIHALEITDEIFQRLVALMKQRQILICIGITCSKCPDLLIKIRVFFRVTAMVLHGNTHDKQVFIRLFTLIPLYNALVKLLVGNIFPQQFCLVKIIYKMRLVKSHSRINRIAAPSRFIVRMHRHTGITDIFQIRDNGCRCVADILLIHDRTTRQKCHGISGHKLPFRVWRFRTKNGGKGMSLHDIVLQGIIIRCHLFIRQKISHHGKIRIRFTHHHNDRRFLLYILVYITFSIAAILVFKFCHHFLGISVRLRNKAVTDTQHIIQDITVAVASFLLPRLSHSAFCLGFNISTTEYRNGNTYHCHPQPFFKFHMDFPHECHIKYRQQYHVNCSVIQHKLIISSHT